MSRTGKTARAAACALGTAAAALLAAAPATAADSVCDEPGERWERRSPESLGMDAEKLRAAIDDASARRSYAVRVYRRGCLVGEDRGARFNREAQYESWSMAKSITSMVFGRAMTLGLITPDDPVGALVTEADEAHGAVTMRHLLTMTSGVYWNGLRDYDIALPDRLSEWLQLPMDKEPGTYYEYAQSSVTILALAVERAVGEDFQAFAQRELFGPVGIDRGDWRWIRDSEGHTQAFFGVNMKPDDFARLGELMRRGGVWKGRRLLQRRFLREALTPTATNECYGWLFWLNGGGTCVSPRTADRPVESGRMFPSAPPDVYQFSGLFDQRITVFPSQDLVFVRTGAPAGGGVDFAGGGEWEDEVYANVLAAITDEPVDVPADATDALAEPVDSDRGFHTALFEPHLFVQPIIDRAVPPAGPHRARAMRVRLAHRRASRTGRVSARVTCPAKADAPCEGTASLAGPPLGDRVVTRPVSVEPGETALVRFRLPAAAQRSLRRRVRATMTLAAVNRDATGSGTRSEVDATLVRARRR